MLNTATSARYNRMNIKFVDDMPLAIFNRGAYLLDIINRIYYNNSMVLQNFTILVKFNQYGRIVTFQLMAELFHRILFGG